LTELFVPGRLCLLGEHSDWAAGYRTAHPDLERGFCLAAGTDQGLRAHVEPLEGAFEISSALPHGERRGPERLPLERDALEAAARGSGFFRYAAGTAAEVLERHAPGGVRIEITASDLPIRRGLSSSAAVSVLVARAFDRVRELGLDLRGEMELAYAGERRCGSECGRLDQICALGRTASHLTFDGEELEIEPLAPGATFWLLVVDLRRGKDTRRILADLNRCFPDAPGERAEGVRHALGALNADLVRRAREALEAGAAESLGALMREAQQVFDRLVAPACPELAAPRLHRVLDHPATRELGLGGKGVGSQGDGCAQIVCRGPEERARLAGELSGPLDVACLPLTLLRDPPNGGIQPRPGEERHSP
jgi:galactokinase